MDADKLFENFPTEDDLMNIIMHTSTTVWESELGVKDIESWLANFKGDVFDVTYERLLALWLLSHFTFYNQKEVKHLCKVIYRDLLHSIMQGVDISKITPENAIKEFFDKTNIISPEKTSGSGGFIAYFFRHENNLPMSLFNFSLENINSGIKNIIVIDDVTLTGTDESQMYKFLDKATKKYHDKRFILLTLVASEAAIDFLKKKFTIEIITAIKLDDRDKCFHKESDVFSAFSDKAEHVDLIDQSKKFAEHYGNKIKVTNALGFADGQYTFGFHYNTPDNALPIFWGQINGWIPILRRYHKNYKNQTFLQDEKFI